MESLTVNLPALKKWLILLSVTRIARRIGAVANDYAAIPTYAECSAVGKLAIRDSA